MVVMSLCDTDKKNQVESTDGYPDLKKKMDLTGLLNLIKKLVYTGGTNDLNTRHNKAMAHINLMNLHKDRFQSLQEFIDQYLSMKKVCNTLQLLMEGAKMTCGQF